MWYNDRQPRPAVQIGRLVILGPEKFGRQTTTFQVHSSKNERKSTAQSVWLRLDRTCHSIFSKKSSVVRIFGFNARSHIVMR